MHRTVDERKITVGGYQPLVFRLHPKKIRKAAFTGLQECWNWPGALDDLSTSAFTELTDRMLSLLNSYWLKKSIKT
jgi:hypothetical protein